MIFKRSPPVAPDFPRELFHKGFNPVITVHRVEAMRKSAFKRTGVYPSDLSLVKKAMDPKYEPYKELRKNRENLTERDYSAMAAYVKKDRAYMNYIRKSGGKK